MRKLFRSTILVTVILSSSVSLTPPAQANHHLVMISKVFLGTPGNLNAQFVQLKAYSGGQNVFLPSNAEVVFYEADGDQIGDGEQFTQNPSPFPDQGSVLVATTTAETTFGVTADLEFTATTGLSPGGAVCFESSSFGRIDCATWGNYAPDGVGEPPADNPFKPSEGIPLGSSMLRKEGNNGLDGGDDSDDSNQDFRPAYPNTASTQGASTVNPVFLVLFVGGDSTVPEDGGPVDFLSGHFNTSDPEAYGAQFSTVQFSATEDDDYGGVDEVMTYPPNDGDDSVSVAINNDSEFEGNERFRVQLRDPTGGAVLGDGLEFFVTISDLEDDDARPDSRITRPEHGKAYKRARLDTIDGTWDDGPGEVDEVFVGLRQNLKNGKCRWLDGDDFARRKCSRKKLLREHTEANGTWDYELDPLPKSVGTNVRNYTAFSKAKDAAGNNETSFEIGRNVHTFEVK